MVQGNARIGINSPNGMTFGLDYRGIGGLYTCQNAPFENGELIRFEYIAGMGGIFDIGILNTNNLKEGDLLTRTDSLVGIYWIQDC